MPTKVMGTEVRSSILTARQAFFNNSSRAVIIDGEEKAIPYPFPSPADWRDYAIYFLMVDRFNNPDKMPAVRWNSICDYWQGGNIKGIQDKLPYLQELGVNAIWISPIFKNAKPAEWKWIYPGYGAQNFLDIDERFGTSQDLINLVNEAHARNIYVILDIVLNHTTRAFDYVYHDNVVDNVSDASLINGPPGSEIPVQWLNGYGQPRSDWKNVIPNNTPLSPDDAIYPEELRNYLFFRRRGSKISDSPGTEGFVKGDFSTMRQLAVEYDATVPGQEKLREELGPHPVLNILVSSYQYLISKYDFDGFRIDTVKYVRSDMIETFGNAIREYALSIGKKNFFTFGEIYDQEDTIAKFVGRNSTNVEGFGIDAALDFPTFYKLPKVAKGQLGVEELRNVFTYRKKAQKGLISSHGEAGQYFVSFLDNHDMNERFFHPLSDKDQIILGLTVLFTLQNIPCIYYGTEQSLQGTTNKNGEPILCCPESVREALWGKDNAFNKKDPIYIELKKILGVRNSNPELRYGRLYFREVSENGMDFGHSYGCGGIIAFSRILGDNEIIVVANTSISKFFKGFVIIDRDTNRLLPTYSVLYSNQNKTASSAPVLDTFNFWENDTHTGIGKSAKLFIELNAKEVQILGVRQS